MQPGNITKLPEIGKHFMSGSRRTSPPTRSSQLAYLKWRASSGKKQVMKGTFGWNNGQAVVLPPSDATKQKMIDRFLGQ